MPVACCHLRVLRASAADPREALAAYVVMPRSDMLGIVYGYGRSCWRTAAGMNRYRLQQAQT
jgi:hypothetical protein